MLNKAKYIVSLSESEAIYLKKEHKRLISPFVNDFRYWRTRGQKHPVYDFLFSYYSFSTGQLLRWSPGTKSKIIYQPGTGEPSFPSLIEWPDHVKISNNSEYVDIHLFPLKRKKFLEWALKYLRITLDRPPVFHCFGMHEWAMVYKADRRQHPETPFRVSENEISKFVESRQICCTHYDAFRFFTPSSSPLNKVQLRRDEVLEHDQAGCIHANMDLYKFGYKIAPFIPSNLLSRLFILAKNARLIDMKASPYDLSEYDVKPLKLETSDGVEQYVSEQKKIHDESVPLRKELIEVYESILSAINGKWER